MKRTVLCLALVLVLIPAVALAAPAPPPGAIEAPDIFVPPWGVIVLTPCALANARADVTTDLGTAINTGASYTYNLYSFTVTFADLGVSGRLISRYSRVTVDSEDMVALEDTFIFDGATIFGRASNIQMGYPGAEGIIMGGVDSSGSPIDIRGSYLYHTKSEGGMEICFFLD